MEKATARLPGLCIALMAGSLLVFQPGGLFRFVWIKIIVIILAVLAGMVAPLRARIPLVLQFTIALSAAWIAVAMSLSETPVASVAGRWPRYEGLLTLGVYAAAFAVGARVLGGNCARQRWSFLRTSLAAAILIMFVVAVLESGGLRPLGGAANVRPGATLGNATDQGLVGLVVAAALLAPAGAERGWHAWLQRAGLIAAAGVAILSGSRAAVAGLLIVAVFGSCQWMRSRSYSPLKILLASGIAVAAVAAGVLLAPATRDRLFSAGTVDGRRLLWDRSLALIAESPVVGVGPSGFVDALPPHLNQQWARSVGDSFPADSPHSWPLQVLSAAGIPLLLLVLVLCATAVVVVIRRIRESARAEDRRYLAVVFVAVAAYALALLTHFTAIGTTGLVAFLCGGLVGREDAGHLRVRITALAAAVPVRLHQGVPRAVGLALVAAGLAISIPSAIAEWPMSTGAKAAAAGDTALAEQSFQQARQLRPWDSDTALLAAQAFAGPATGGDLQAARYAVEWGSLARERTPHSLEAGTALAIGRIYSGDLEGAKALLDQLVEEAPFSTGLYVQRGVANFGLGLPDESIRDLQHAASLDPGLDTPWHILAGVYQRLGDDEAAQDASQHAESLKAG